MRDDIHKGAPVGRYWKLLIKVCARDADWEQSAPDAAQKAVAEELGAQGGQVFFLRLEKRLSGSQMSLVPDLSLLAAESARGLPLSPVQTHAVTRVLAADRSEVNRGVLAESAALYGLRAVMEATARNMDAYFARECPRDRREMMRRLRVALASVPLDEWAKRAVVGDIPRAIVPRRPLSLDEQIG